MLGWKILIFLLSGLGGLYCIIYRKKLPPVFLRLGIFLLFAMLSQLTGYLLNSYTGRNADYYNIVLAINYVLIFSIFFGMSKNRAYRIQIMRVFSVGILIFSYYIIAAFGSNFASRALTVSNIIVVIYCLLYLYEMLKIPIELPLIKQGRFWIATAFLVSHVSGFTFWLLFEYVSSLSNPVWLSPMNYALTILEYCLFIVSLVVQIKFKSFDESSARRTMRPT